MQKCRYSSVPWGAQVHALATQHASITVHWLTRAAGGWTELRKRVTEVCKRLDKGR